MPYTTPYKGDSVQVTFETTNPQLCYHRTHMHEYWWNNSGPKYKRSFSAFFQKSWNFPDSTLFRTAPTTPRNTNSMHMR